MKQVIGWAAVLALTACAATDDSGGPAPRAATPAPAPGASGIVQYDGYLAARAGEGETVADIARRVGLDPGLLAAYNGLSPADRLRAGDELALPPSDLEGTLSAAN